MVGKRILVIEDYRQLRELLGTVLRELAGCVVETAPDSASAARLIAHQTFDLVVSDIGVPGTVGAREIAASARARFGCPILFITGHDLAEGDRSDLMQPGDRFLRKPFAMTVLLQEVATLLSTAAGKRPHKRPRAARAVAARAAR